MNRVPPPLRQIPVEEPNPDQIADDDVLPLEVPGAERWALPAAVAFSWLVNGTTFPGALLGFFSIWVHELGHAAFAWLSSRAATPLPFFFTAVGEQQSWGVYFFFLLLLSLKAYQGWASGLLWMVVASFGVALMQFAFTVMLPASTTLMLIGFGGVAGEFFISAVLVMLFYRRFPRKWRWDFWRFFGLGLGAFTLVRATVMWWRIWHNPALLPWGSIFSADMGDMTMLRDGFHWTAADITHAYLNCAAISWALVGIAYVQGLIADRRQRA